MKSTSDKYKDIIGLPHYVSPSRPQMSRRSRAAQFAPFAALTGYEDIVAEAARLTGERHELSEDRQARINERLRIILENIGERPEVMITFFLPDTRKAGGEYREASGAVRRIDEYSLKVIFADGREIPIEDIYDICGEIFPTDEE